MMVNSGCVRRGVGPELKAKVPAVFANGFIFEDVPWFLARVGDVLANRLRFKGQERAFLQNPLAVCEFQSSKVPARVADDQFVGIAADLCQC